MGPVLLLSDTTSALSHPDGDIDGDRVMLMDTTEILGVVMKRIKWSLEDKMWHTLPVTGPTSSHSPCPSLLLTPILDSK
jgi:hypothetical protein